MFPFAMIESQNAMNHEVRSALPNAPVVAPPCRCSGARGPGPVRSARPSPQRCTGRLTRSLRPRCSPAR